jgi:rhamnogalacturonyl hydrolase YesR
MTPDPPAELQSDLDVAICGPSHQDHWCKYCQALRQLNVSVTEEREACAQLAESLINLNESQDWQEGFNMACAILAHTIRARNRADTIEKVLRSFKRLSRSIAASQTVRLQVHITSAGRKDNCSPAGP